MKEFEEKNTQQRIQKLRAEITRLRNEYHLKNTPNVTDDVYDSLTRELRVLLRKYPRFDDPNASENRVAGKPLSKFVKVKHKIRMLSLNDVFSVEELSDWEKRIKKLLPPGKTPDVGEGFNYFCEVNFLTILRLNLPWLKYLIMFLNQKKKLIMVIILIEHYFYQMLI